MNFVKSLKASWRTLAVILTPILLSPLVFPYNETSKESKCAALMMLMGVYWLTEAVPLPVTSLLPIALGPLLGLASSRQLCKAFFGDATFLLIGGIIVAIAIEETKLHKRFALRTLMMIGVEPRRLLLGIMLTTGFLSMWISNTATTALMMPVTRALLTKLFNAANLAKRRLASGGQTAATEGQVQQNDMVSSISVNVSKRERSKSFSNDVLSWETLEPQVLGPSTTALAVMNDRSTTHLDHHPHHNQHGHHEARRYKSDHDLAGKGHREQMELQDIGTSPSKEAPDVQSDDEEDDDEVLENLDSQRRAMLKAFSLSVCYSANIGGMATLTGTTPNMVLSRIASEISGTSLVTFANWFAFGLPVSVIILIGCYLWMNISVFGLINTLTCRSTATAEEVKQARETIRSEYRSLGKMRFNEVIVLIHFLVLVVLWLARDPGSIPGWTSLFPHKYISDSSTALAIAVCLFVFPNEKPNVLFFRSKGDTSPAKSTPSILNWKQTSRKFPWGVIFLLGGGFALSEVSKASGMSRLIASKLMFVRELPTWTASLVVTAMTAFATELTTNLVVVMLVLPILRDMAVVMNVHPMYLMLPATIAASLAFMLPIATVPNALVFAYGDIRTLDMVKAGCVMNVVGVAAVVMAINTWGYAIYDLGVFPSWALPEGAIAGSTNYTMTLVTNNNSTLVT